MAGSYGHVNTEDGGWSLIENMGDAHECVEELLWLVLWFSQISYKTNSIHVANACIRAVINEVFYPMARGEKPPDEAYEAVKQVMNR